MKELKVAIYIVLLILVACKPKEKIIEQNNKPNQDVQFKLFFSEAITQQMLKNYDNALGLYQKCIGIKPKSSASFYQIARIFYFKNDFNAAQNFIKKAIEINDTNIWYRLFAADLFIIKNDYNEAIQQYELITKHNSNEYYKYNLIELIIQNEEYNEALKRLNYLQNINGFTEDIFLLKSEIYYKTDNSKELEELIILATEVFPNSLYYLGMLAEYYTGEKQFEKAQNVYNQMLNLEPDDGLTNLSYSNFCKISGNYSNYYIYLHKAFSDPELDVNRKIDVLADFLYDNTNPLVTSNQLYNLFNISIELHSNEVDIHKLFADFLISEGSFDQAINELITILENDKSDKDTYDRLIRALLMINDFEAVNDYSSEAVNLYPNLPLFYLYKGIALSKLGMHPQAREILNSGILIIIDNKLLLGEFYYYIAETYSNEEQFSKAETYFDKALKYNAQNLTILNNYSYYLAKRGINLQKALELNIKCLNIEPENPSFLDTRAWIYYQQNKYNEAKSFAQRAIYFSNATNPIILEHYGDILFKLGEKTEAIKQWKKALSLDKNNNELKIKINK